jgi:hypothetical protein
MSEMESVATSQSYAYADTYAIQVIPTISYDNGALALFLAEDGATTVWPCMAELFDSAEDAQEKLLTATLPSEYEEDDGAYMRVVHLVLNAKVEIVEMNEVGIKKAA